MFNKIKKLFNSGNDNEDSEKDIVSLKFYDDLSATHIPKLKEYGVTDLEILDVYEKSNGRERDMIWSLYNQLLLKINPERTTLLKEIYEDMISMLDEEEKGSNHLVEKVNILTLREIKSAGINRVEIGSERDGLCNKGLKLDGQVYLVDDALENCPIPALKCEKKHCGCSFFPIAE